MLSGPHIRPNTATKYQVRIYSDTTEYSSQQFAAYGHKGNTCRIWITIQLHIAFRYWQVEQFLGFNSTLFGMKCTESTQKETVTWT